MTNLLLSFPNGSVRQRSAERLHRERPEPAERAVRRARSPSAGVSCISSRKGDYFGLLDMA